MQTSADTIQARTAVPAGPSNPARGINGEPGTADPATLPYTCRCGTRWNGTRTAHCAAQCHRTFTGVTGFDAHRRDGQCVDPASLGMVVIPGRAYEVWGHTDTDDSAREHGRGEGVGG